MRLAPGCILIPLGQRNGWLRSTGHPGKPGLRLELQASDGSLKLIDKATGAVWAVGPPHVVLADRGVQPAGPAGEVIQSRDTLTLPECLRPGVSPPARPEPRCH